MYPHAYRHAYRVQMSRPETLFEMSCMSLHKKASSKGQNVSKGAKLQARLAFLFSLELCVNYFCSRTAYQSLPDYITHKISRPKTDTANIESASLGHCVVSSEHETQLTSSRASSDRVISPEVAFLRVCRPLKVLYL